MGTHYFSSVLLAALLLISMNGFTEGSAGAAQAINLRCEYRDDPLGIDVTAPRLSWRIDAKGSYNVSQSAYRVLVASTRALLDSNTGDLWDSAQVASTETINIRYAGTTLTSGQACWWKVCIWDQDGTAVWSEAAHWTMGLLRRDDWKGEWIGIETPEALQGAELLPAVQMRRAFTLNEAPVRATLYATGLGIFEMYLNGERVADEIFAPGWTEYHKRIYYRTYNVTDRIQGAGEHVWGVWLGDGWFGLHHFGKGHLRFRGQLHLEYANGKEEILTSDDAWKATLEGPVRSSDMYDGEIYDAARDLAGWHAPGYDDSAWQPVVTGIPELSIYWDVTKEVKALVKDNILHTQATTELWGDPAPGKQKYLMVHYKLNGYEEFKPYREGREIWLGGEDKQFEVLSAKWGVGKPGLDTAVIQAHPGEPVRITEEIETVALTEPQPGVYVFDFGQNFSGWVRLKVQGPAGTTITTQYAEMLKEDGTAYTENLRKADSRNTYILKGDGEEVWEPRFTFHGFRYVEVKGFPGKPTNDSLRGMVLNSDMKRTGYFECSNPMLNQLVSNIAWGQRSNYLEIPTDCPQRDERLGWSGDAQVFIGTGAHFFDIASFFTAWMYTFNDSQFDNGGYPNISPKGGGVAPAWGDAGTICPWTLQQLYGDTAMVARHYDDMKEWITYLKDRSDGLIRPDKGFADWLNLDDPTPRDLIATAYFAYSTKLMENMATSIGQHADAAYYNGLHAEIRQAFQEKYIDENGQLEGDSQTGYLMCLDFDLFPEALREKAAQRLLEKFEERNWHLSTGFLGVNLLLPVLTDIGRPDVAYRLLENETYPSWGYSIAQGATTVWERWNSYTHEDGFGDAGMNSFNHYAYGSCGVWMFDTIAGINSTENAFKEILIAPLPGGTLTYAKASYDSIRGTIVSNWEKTADGLVMEVEIPANTTASIVVPAPETAAVVAYPIGLAASVRDDTRVTYKVGSGKYRFLVTE